MQVVLDTNVLVSGLIWPHGPLAQIINRWLGGEFTLLTMPAMLEELEDVLNRVGLRSRLTNTSERAPDLLEAVTVLSEHVVGYVNVAGAVADPFDEMFLACASLGEADYLVTGDKELLTLADFGKTAIIPPTRFLQLLEERNS